MTSTKENKAYQSWLKLCKQINDSTLDIQMENEAQKETRISKLKNNPFKFWKYYFPHYVKSDFGWFHKKAAKAIIDDPTIFAVLEWPREHAKSVFVDVLIPLYLYYTDQLDGFIVASSNADKAIGLLSDIKAELQSNNRLIHDFGAQSRSGDWRDGKFSTVSGVGFWAFGRGQSPRGTRNAEKRPNYIVWDDIDDKEIVRNDKRVRDAKNWLLEDLYGAGSIKGCRFVGAGNRIHKRSILANIVGDVEPGDPVNPNITHIKVFAIERGSRHLKADFNNGRPAWKENYSLSQLRDKMTKMGTLASRREYFHEHHEEGNIFQPEWFHYIQSLPIQKYDGIVAYCDPSFKDTKKNDFKAIVVLGKINGEYHLLDIWCKQASVKAMVSAFYDLFEKYENYAKYWMEASFMQDTLVDEVYNESESRGVSIPLRGDKRKKPDKFSRIENQSPLWERGLYKVCKKIQASPDFQEFKIQLLGFPYGHDDAPDAMEGAQFKLIKINRPGRDAKARTGRYKSKSKRYA